MVQIAYELRARQQTSLTPRLQQSLKLLQMSTLDFSQEVAQAIATNPFLEEPENAPGEAEEAAGDASPAEAGMSATDGGGSGEDGGPAVETVERPVAEATDAVEVLPEQTESSPSYSGDYPTTRHTDGADTDVGQWARASIGLHDALRENVRGQPLSERDSLLTEFIIEALDEDGYLRVPFEELASDDLLSPPPSECEWNTALKLIQQLAAPGIAARNLSECLTLQLESLPDDTRCRDLAVRIANSALEKVGRCDYSGLIRSFDCSEEDARTACLLIRGLDPRPGTRFASIDPSCYIVPDVMVRKLGKQWVALSNQEAVPRAQLHTTYARLFKESRYNDRSLMAKALQEARWLIRSLEQRNTTILRVAQAIVARQQTFFDYGDVALRPLMLSEIAEELGMHESTVSRATSNKYLSSPRGIFEFKHFFSRELATRSGGTCSAGSVRALIQEMIDAEDPKDPLSDVMLARKLAGQGVVVARRTVSKYRAQIKYPSAELRRAP
ncbi:RNA polymerase factor sigma-54 [Pusillimonas noertemannii]|uniref:RNA polymerase sigma-54 factor n=1 Tax=Pusillimonas noertemannii TaxID=305977 RepID=A0A2U1CL98_9BURK|nr:RNA polymerase factor sigma-54 [Pusillimonas noertemannii]NYT69325.1 RNA polymerase factor sigma-54 [Pusillimonas noertemannii]PVY61790.1 RNA polymerase RpoN-/SigL-like sigma 54 subunit [Pusillimonas noertemannii]TFL09725.1 RNA polymerase factor sigma-54 [Pusillimonas noertemannii]